MRKTFLAAGRILSLVIVMNMLGANASGATEFRRELSTDRPDKTESPYTVEAGGFQFELNLGSLGFRDTQPTDTTELHERLGSFGATIKYGLSSDIDLQLVLGYEGASRWTDGTGIRSGQSKFPTLGFADPGLRLKINLEGNDHGNLAVGLMPYLFFPIGEELVENHDWEGGLIIPAALALSSSASCGFMAELDVLSDAEGHHPEFATSATTAFDMSRSIGMYVEVFQKVDLRGDAPWQPTLDTGFTFGFGENIQLDLGVNIGLNRQSDDFNPFLGFSFRL